MYVLGLLPVYPDDVPCGHFLVRFYKNWHTSPPVCTLLCSLVRSSNTGDDTAGYDSNLSTSAPLHTTGYQSGCTEMQGTVPPAEFMAGSTNTRVKRISTSESQFEKMYYGCSQLSK